MVNNPYILDKLKLSGFRAFLEPQEFDFGSKGCLAVFAPNRYGKSSIVDALEFMFSERGTLERLGLRAIHNQAGPAALAHNLAEEKGFESYVQIVFKHDGRKLEGRRIARGSIRERPAVADSVVECFTVDPLIRGYALRKFVENRTAEERYEYVAKWLQLRPFVDVQRNLRTLRQRAKSATETRIGLDDVNRQLARETANSLLEWDDDAVLTYLNNLLGQLDTALTLETLDRGDSAFITVQDRARAEEEQLGIAGLRLVLQSAAALYSENKDPETDDIRIAGLIVEFEMAVDSNETAKTIEHAERSSASNYVFDEVWKAAQPLFGGDVEAPDTCPVCTTPIADSAAGSAEGVRQHLDTHRTELAAYISAKEKLENTKRIARQAHGRLVQALKTLRSLIPEEHSSFNKVLGKYEATVAKWSQGAYPDATYVKASIVTLTKELEEEIAAILAKQGDNTYRQVLDKLEKLIELKEEQERVTGLLAELGKLATSMDVQSAFISDCIRERVQTLLDSLQTPINEIYRQIQGPDAVSIRLELPPEEEINQQRLNLVVDFASNRPGVQPSGYLSDSQIHSLALALRLVAIKRFNTAAPIIALDDIVTSYDADHRRSIAALLAKEFADFQLIITTLDERFFIYLKDQLRDQEWQYKRITRLDPNFGPRFSDHRVTETLIDSVWDHGDSAANEMRQAEEEWLLRICRDFGVNLRIRPVERAYSYERSELASALAKFLSEKGYSPPQVPGVNNLFLTSLQRGAIENFGSHFNDAPYGDGSIGDERARWEEFKFFRDQFACPTCGRTRFKRPIGMSKPVCSKTGCETKFRFIEPI